MKIGPSAKNISTHHNLFAHNYRRNPKLSRDHNATGEVINNIVYNWRNRATDILANVNVIANVYKTGADWNRHNKGITIKDVPGIKVYVNENIGPGRSTNLRDDWLAVTGLEKYRADAPVIPLSNVHIDPVTEVFDLVLSNAGATVPHRDAVDVRIVRSVREGSGSLIDSQSEVGGWSLLAPGKPPRDTDHDGMPDKWEVDHGLDPNEPSDGIEDRDSDGYTNVEEYLNSLIPN
jgi:hypothetical protein